MAETSSNGEAPIKTSKNPEVQRRVENTKAYILKRYPSANPVSVNEDARRVVAERLTNERKSAEIRKLRPLVQIDTLTGLPNRRYFQERLPQAIKEAQRTGRPLWLAFVDIDNFKDFNSSFGHEGGDEALKQVAKLPTRLEEPFMRLAGDEFVQLLNENIEAEEISLIINRYREAIKKSSTTSFENTPIQPETDPSKVIREVTLSFGLALYEGESPTEFVAKANQAMYQAKQEGKNTAFIAQNSDEGLRFTEINKQING